MEWSKLVASSGEELGLQQTEREIKLIEDRRSRFLTAAQRQFDLKIVQLEVGDLDICRP